MFIVVISVILFSCIKNSTILGVGEAPLLNRQCRGKLFSLKKFSLFSV